MSFDREPPLTLEPQPGRSPRRLRGGAVLIGLAAAGALGLAIGLALRPQLVTDMIAPDMQPRPETAGRGMDIVMGEPAPDAPLPPRPPLETMDEDPYAPTAPEPPIPPTAPMAPVAQVPPAPPFAPIARVAPQAPDPAWRGGRRPGFDCRDAGSLAEELVCADAVLAAADRQMGRAYDRALRAGVPAEELSADQDDWMATREDFALQSPRALARLYDQRIATLNALADEAVR